MNLLKTNIKDAPREFRAPRTMTPDELGDSLARLVWESFSDFVAEIEPDEDAEILVAQKFTLSEVLAVSGDGVTQGHAAEEALVFFMWAHTRGTQLAFIGRASDDLVRRGLDIMHSAVFDDMVFHGTPASQLPIFEQRVSARYAEYAAAAELSDARLGRVVLRHLTGSEEPPESVIRAIVERAIAVANPLRDFLEDVELTE